MKERELQQAIRESLGMESDLLLYRNTVGVTSEFDPKTHEKRVIRYGLCTGSADLIGVVRVEPVRRPVGRFFAIEVKKPGEYPTPEQKRWAGLVRTFGGFVATCRSVEEACDALERARAGADQ